LSQVLEPLSLKALDDEYRLCRFLGDRVEAGRFAANLRYRLVELAPTGDDGWFDVGTDDALRPITPTGRSHDDHIVNICVGAFRDHDRILGPVGVIVPRDSIDDLGGRLILATR
jgi:hypothetical protein